jgi:hypothetical protein
MFERERGFRQHLLTSDRETRAGIRFWLERVRSAYGPEPCVDMQVIEDQVLLNERSVRYLYGPYTPAKTVYRRGSRPFLEQILAAVVRPGMGEAKRFHAILRLCRDNRDRADPAIRFFGGNEEELIKRGASMCNEISRVFVVLCQMAGLPARLVSTHITGHMMAEARIGRDWAWCDPQKGLYLIRDDGRYASTWDLKRDPGILDRQQPALWRECRPTPPREDPAFAALHRAHYQAYVRDCCFHPREAVALGNYLIADHARYAYPWHTTVADQRRLEAARTAETTLRMRLGFPTCYFAAGAGLFEEMPLRMRRGPHVPPSRR